MDGKTNASSGENNFFQGNEKTGTFLAPTAYSSYTNDLTLTDMESGKIYMIMVNHDNTNQVTFEAGQDCELIKYLTATNNAGAAVFKAKNSSCTITIKGYNNANSSKQINWKVG